MPVLLVLGTAEPEGVEVASPGKLYFKTTAPQAFYIKLTGEDNTGWLELIGI